MKVKITVEHASHEKIEVEEHDLINALYGLEIKFRNYMEENPRIKQTCFKDLRITLTQ